MIYLFALVFRRLSKDASRIFTSQMKHCHFSLSFSVALSFVRGEMNFIEPLTPNDAPARLRGIISLGPCNFITLEVRGCQRRVSATLNLLFTEK